MPNGNPNPGPPGQFQDKRVSMKVVATMTDDQDNNRIMWQTENEWKDTPYPAAVLMQHALDAVNQVGLALGIEVAKDRIPPHLMPKVQKAFEEVKEMSMNPLQNGMGSSSD